MTTRKPNAVRDDAPRDAPEAKAKAEKADAAVSKPVQEAADVETSQGFSGVEVDPTPNEHYTVQGRGEGLPVPETHDEAAKAARERMSALGQDPRA
jgi:hypothetical protein